MPKAAQRQFLISVAGVAGTFANKSGGEVSGDSTKVWDGGSLTPELLSSPSEVANVTVSRPFDPARDWPILHRLRSQVNRWRTSVSITPTDADLIPNGNAVVYANALLTRVAFPDVDASSGDPATFELEFIVGSIA